MPEWSVVIPAYRERALQHCIDRVRSVARARDIEIIVSGADGGWSADRILRPGSGLRAIDAPKGRGSQIARGIAVARAEKILVLHADTELPCGAFELMDRALAKRDVGAFLFRMDSKNPILAFSAFNANIRSILTRVPFGDQAHFFRKGIVGETGGYPAIPLFEDVDFMERVKRHNIPIAFVPRAVVTSGRRYRALGYWRTTLRNWRLQLDWKRGVGADELAVRYRKGVEPRKCNASSAGDAARTAIIVFHRALRPGFVKTRLAKRIGDSSTLDLYRAFLVDLEKTILETEAAIIPFVDIADDPSLLFWPLASEQTGADLGQRMANAIRETVDRGFEKILLIGSDVPHLRKRDLEDAFYSLTESDVVFGPATDGGYYLVGVNATTFDPSIFALPEWSHDRVLAESRALCEAAGLSVALCETLTDFDGVEDIEAWFRSRDSRKRAGFTWNVWNSVR